MHVCVYACVCQVHEVHVRAHGLFSLCPGGVMTSSMEEIGRLAHEVCGFPAYFARPLFSRILRHALDMGRPTGGCACGPCVCTEQGVPSVCVRWGVCAGEVSPSLGCVCRLGGA